MKRFLLFCFLFSTYAFAQNGTKHKAENVLFPLSPENIKATHQIHKSSSSSPEAVLFSEDFSSGIPSNWANFGYDTAGNVLTNALWEYRGPNTTPSNQVGSRGAFASGVPIASPTANNGFVIFDSDFLDNGGVASNLGNGSAPAPHIGTLTSPTINLSGSPEVILNFTSFCRVHNSKIYVAFSSDGGNTWPHIVRVHEFLPMEAATRKNIDYAIDASNYIGNSSQAKFRFIFDGSPDPNISNSGGFYFWQIDDISIIDQPKNEIRFTSQSDIELFPPQDLVTNIGAANSKLGYTAYDYTGPYQTDERRSIEFSASIVNTGTLTQNQIFLEVDVISQSSGLLIGTYSSLAGLTLLPHDTVSGSQLNTVGNAFYPPATQDTYGIVYRVKSDSAEAISDTFLLRVTTDVMSLDFNEYYNDIGTPLLGNDGSALAPQIDFLHKSRIFDVDVMISPNTVPGGHVEVEVYRADGFDFILGFSANSLLGVSQTHTITPVDVSNEMINLSVSDGVNSFIDVDEGEYFIVVNMYSNAGLNPIQIKNDQTFPQCCHIMFDSNQNQWFSGYSNSATFNAPHVRVHAVNIHNQNISEIQSHQCIDIAPNPASERINLDFCADAAGEYDVSLYDVNGRKVYSDAAHIEHGGRFSIDVQKLPSGIYALHILHQGEATFKKIIVE